LKLDFYNNKNNILLLYMADIKTTILTNLTTIKETLRGNNKFLSDINLGVDELKQFVENLIKTCRLAKQNLSIQMNTVASGNEKIGELENKANGLQEKISALESELNTLKASSESDNVTRDNDLNEEIKRLREEINKITADRDNIKLEKDTVVAERDGALENINKLNADLQEINDSLEGLKADINNPDVSALYQKILDKIKELQAMITNFNSEEGVGAVTGGRRRRHRGKHITKKIKKSVMKGGFIADYKPKTHRRHKHKKRSSSSRRSKKYRYTTTTSRSTSKSTSSY
jgi:DNA repair exonuclease SbcCD ATPase subunit